MASKAWIASAATCIWLISLNSYALDSARELRQARLSPLSQGAHLYKSHCALCHGEIGSGTTRARSVYQGADLDLRDFNGEGVKHDINSSIAGLMPPLAEALSEQQIEYIAEYIQVIDEPVNRGKAIFMQYCTLCHGIRGDGKGRASRMHNPPPANLTLSDKNDDYKRLIITYGGEAMGRNPAMPVWGNELGEQEIEDVIEYTNSIRVMPLKDILKNVGSE